MLEKFAGFTIIAGVVLAFVGSVPTPAENVVVSQAWSRASPKGAQVASGYLTIENHAARADRLLSAASPAAAKLEIHQMRMQDGIMTMRPLDNGLSIPPDTTVTLAPGGDHIMFVGLTAPFEEGQRIPVSLNFERSGRIDTTFEVGSVGAKGPRLQVAAAGPAASSPTLSKAASADEPFFTHLCGTRVMANVTVSPGKKGPVEVLVQLEDAEEKPLAVETLSVTLSNPDAGVAPVTAQAERVAADSWRVRMSPETAGKWSLSLGIGLGKDDRVDIAAPILIE
jgi:copper(I)-binding protein